MAAGGIKIVRMAGCCCVVVQLCPLFYLIAFVFRNIYRFLIRGDYFYSPDWHSTSLLLQ